MPNDRLVVTLNETLRELTEKQRQSDAFVVDRRGIAERARHNLQIAQDQEKCAIHDDEEIVAKKRELLDYYNGLAEKPQALSDKIDSLGVEQSATSRKRQEAARIVQQRQQELRDAETRSVVAQKDLETVQK